MKVDLIERALACKYGTSVVAFELQQAYHGDAPDDCSFMMVWYTDSKGMVGRQWFETIRQWAEGNTNYYFEHSW